MKSATCINLAITMGKSIHKLKHVIIDKKGKLVINKKIIMQDLIIEAKKQKSKKEAKIRISAIIPNYNYENFLMERIYSILNQTEKIYELIILDDFSKDNSRNLIDNIIKELEPYIMIQKVYNNSNSGNAFKQWEKGFTLAKGDYVWIAEADDYCNKNMIKALVKSIERDTNIVIAYVDTAFIDKQGKIFLKSIKPEIDIRKTGHWNKSYINKGEEELNKYTFLNCTIANVSSTLIKNGEYSEIFKQCIQYHQSGDWVFYANIMKLGNVAYINKPYNYYRVHGNNITSTMKKKKHLEEIKKIHNSMYSLTSIEKWHEEEFKKRYKFLEKVWELK